jgi:hypothetical protein
MKQPSSRKSPLTLISPFTTVPALNRFMEGTSSSLFFTIDYCFFNRGQNYRQPKGKRKSLTLKKILIKKQRKHNGE